MASIGPSVPTPDVTARRRFLSAASSVAYTGTQGRIGPLDQGVHYLTATTDAFFLQGGSAVAATTSSNPLWSKSYVTVWVSDDDTDLDGYISVIQSSAGGTAYAIKVS